LTSASEWLGTIDPLYTIAELTWNEKRWLQDVFDVPLIIMMTDGKLRRHYLGGIQTNDCADEKFLFSEKRTVEEVMGYTRTNVKDIIAIGFDSEKTFIFSDYDYMGGAFYRNITRFAKLVNLNTARSVFGFDER
jgi:tryptophanyl-tRNA synthetase